MFYPEYEPSGISESSSQTFEQGPNEHIEERADPFINGTLTSRD